MELKVNNPNLSVILPVGCNAHCSFCYWEKETGLTPDRFKFIAESLPKPLFNQVSLTGGETTLSEDLTDYLKIAKENFSKVVLNTNGYKLTKEHIQLANHVNISRHHWLDEENDKVFKAKTIDVDRLKELSSYGDITLNCVLPDGFYDMDFISNYITFAKEMKAKVAFRKYFNNLNKLPVDTNDTLNWEHSCPACLHRNHTIDGADVTFKYSVQETSEAIDGIYELVLQANGSLTVDWAGKTKLEWKEV